MASYVGSSLIVKWAWASGTLQMDVDYRSFNYTPSINLFDQTAGADANASYLVGFANGQANCSGLLQAGSMPAYASALKEGNTGTIIYYPEGTANGNYRGTVPAISQGLAQNYAYNNLVEFSSSWQQNGVRTEGTA